MDRVRNLRPGAPASIALLATLAALGLAWLAHEAPRALPPALYLDALGALFLLLLWGGLALLWLGQPAAAPGRRTWAAAALLALAFVTSLAPLLIAAYLLVALALPAEGSAGPAAPGGLPARLRRIPPGQLLAAGLLALGYGALALGGAVRLDAPEAGRALASPAFVCVLLATTLGLWRAGAAAGPTGELLRLTWLYPLARLYTLGPWNDGWALAALLLGGGLALWASAAALVDHDPAARVRQSYAWLALSGVGLATGAGLAAGCFAALTAALLIGGMAGATPGRDAGERPIGVWLLSGAVPLTAPSVAAWMLVGAGAAGGVGLLAGAAWLTVLLGALALTLRPPATLPRALSVAAALSLATGVAAPLVVRTLIQPVVAQLQGGLTVYGDVDVWPWVGLAAVDSARRGVTALPTIGAAGLMLVLGALTYLLGRLLAGGAAAPAPAPPPPRDLAHDLRVLVPWLGGARPGDEGRGDDR